MNESLNHYFKSLYIADNVEDTTYFPPKKLMTANTLSNNLSSSRTERWKFGWEIYSKEYNLLQKLTGNGFNFMNWYGYYFLKDKTKSDWPHNPFLAVLLYSGVVGLLLYLLLLYKVFNYYIKYIREYHVFFIFFLITFFFSFFSGSSPFDPPIMGFFILLPFFMHNIRKT
jgi:O-antigen ligase